MDKRDHKTPEEFGKAKLNPLQVQAVEGYYDAIDDVLFDGEPTLAEINANKHGDTLFTFLVNEVGDAGDAQEAKDMLMRAAYQLLHVARRIA